MAVLEIAHTALLGDLFRPWYFLPFAAHYAVLGLVALLIRNERFQTLAAGYYALSLCVWLFVVRRLLA